MAVQKTRNFSHLVIYSCWKYGAFTAVKNNGKFLTYAWNAYHLSWKGIQQGYNFSVKNSMYKRVTVGLDLATESSGIKVCCEEKLNIQLNLRKSFHWPDGFGISLFFNRPTRWKENYRSSYCFLVSLLWWRWQLTKTKVNSLALKSAATTGYRYFFKSPQKIKNWLKMNRDESVVQCCRLPKEICFGFKYIVNWPVQLLLHEGLTILVLLFANIWLSRMPSL